MPRRSGQIGFRGEILNHLRSFILDDFEIVLVEIGDEAALLIHHGEEHIDARHFHGDARGVFACYHGSLLRGAHHGAQRPYRRQSGPNLHIC